MCAGTHNQTEGIMSVDQIIYHKTSFRIFFLPFDKSWKYLNRYSYIPIEDAIYDATNY